MKAKAKLRIDKYIGRKNATMIESMALTKQSRSGRINKSLLCMEMTYLLDSFYLSPGVMLRAWQVQEISGVGSIVVAVDIDDVGEEVWNSAEGWIADAA
jgi:hypothetical protein